MTVSASQKKPVRIQLDFDDGSKEYLDGDALQKWLDDVNGCLAFMQSTRGYMLSEDFMQVEWKAVS